MVSIFQEKTLLDKYYTNDWTNILAHVNEEPYLFIIYISLKKILD